MGAKGEIVHKPIPIDYILSITNGGWSIFVKEIGNFPVSRAFKHPLKKDRHPSGAIFKGGDIWFLKDFAGDIPTITAIQFVQRKYNLSFRETMDKICNDLGITEVDRQYTAVEPIRKPPEYGNSDLHIAFSEGKWRREHHIFWDGTQVDEKHCVKYGTYAVKEAAIGRRRIYIGPKEVVWAYYAEDIDRVKLYFPERQKGYKFRGNVSNNYIWNIHNIEGCNKLIVQKSMKDLLCTTIITPCVIAVQNEDSAIFMNALADRVSELAEDVWIAFGSDEHGVKHSSILSEKYKFGWVNPPKRLLPQINDAYSLEKSFGVEAWEKCLKDKKII